LELGTKNFPKPARASTKYIYVTNTFWFDFVVY
jgi:hypothetical protein